jgi:hypothetical protein
MSDSFGLPTPPPPPPAVPSSSPADESPTLKGNDQAFELEQLLERVGVPPLQPMPWQYRQRMQLRLLFARMGELFPEGGVQFDDADVEAAQPYIDFIADVDDLFMSVATNPRAYTAWSAGLKDAEQVLIALLVRYARAVGESTQSAASSTATASN